MIYYRRYIGAYQKRTTRLSMRDHGAYALMLDFYYAEEQPLPLELEDIYDICKVRTPDDRKAVDKVLRLHFEKRTDGYHNDRADHEISVSGQARINGKSGGRPKREKRTGSQTGMETSDITGSETEHETGTETEEQTGSGHPSTFNHSAFQPFSLQPPTDSSPPEPEGQPAGTRAGAIAAYLRKSEAERGKATKIHSAHPLVQQWASKGVTDDQLREAYELAVADRVAAGEDTAINAGFLDVFLGKLLNPKAATTRVNGHGKPWYCSASAIEAKGKEKGIEQADDEPFPTFRDRVFSAYGVTVDQVQQAQRDFA